MAFFKHCLTGFVWQIFRLMEGRMKEASTPAPEKEPEKNNKEKQQRAMKRHTTNT